MLKFLDRIGYFIEHILVLEIEALQRVIQWLDLRRHVESFRIRKISDGTLHKPSAKFLILVVHTQSTLPIFTRNLIAAINESPFNLIVVSNGELDLSAVSELLQNCHLLIERKKWC